MTNEDEDVYLPSGPVMRRYGKSDMTLHRWIRDEKLGFPQPLYIGRCRYWRLSELVAWERGLPKGRAAASETGEAA